MNIRNRDIIGCFPLLASVLADKYGVKIHIGGEQAKTDGNVIYIPAMPAQLDEENLAMARGYVDHESAHVRHTNFGLLEKAGLDKLEAWLFNAIEDWRVEGKLAGVFPGCGENFRKLVIKLFGKTTGTGRKNPVLAILDYVLLTARSWAVPEIIPAKNQTGTFLDENFRDLRVKLDNLLSQIPDKCPDTGAAIEHAKRITNLIRRYFKTNLSDENQKLNGHGNEDTEKQEDNQTQTDQYQAAKAENNISNSGQTANGNAGQCQTQTSGKAEIDPHNSQAGQSAHELDDLMSGVDASLPQNLGDILSSRLASLAVPEKENGIVVARTGTKEVSAFSKEEALEALRGSVALRQRLAGLLQAKASGYAGMGRKGKLDSGHLHRICVGDAHVFRRDMEKTALNTAFHILLDCSSSMSGAGMSMARKACYALVRALARVKGVNLALTAFPAERGKASVYPVIRHGQGANKMPSLGSFGATPLGPALWWVMTDMLPLKENRKIILVLSDGVPNSVKAAKTAIAQCQKLKMEVMGIGIQSQAIGSLLPDSGRTIWKLEELTTAMFELVRKALINGGVK